MNVDLTLILSIVGILVMIYALWLVLSLKRKMPGGIVGRTWNVLTALVALFAAGYVVMPLLGSLSEDLLKLAVSIIFLFGAVYVVITITLIRKVIRALTE